MTDQSSILTTLEKRICSEWERSADNHPPVAPSLVVFNHNVSPPDFELSGGYNEGLALLLKSGKNDTGLLWGGIRVGRSCSEELPIQTSSLGAVFLSHVVSKGNEPQLAEACRVLQPGGMLLILGLNRYGFRYLKDRSEDGLPGIRPLAVREHLEQYDMSVQRVLAAGFLNSQWPPRMNIGAGRLLVPVADLVLIVARKYEPRLFTPVSKRKMRTANAHSALVGP
ncbi:MAG TPA: hypothetical protein VJ984_06105 [Xanthomonadales bacterium]|nr:hypothetical protein [Xanthomonadales bacterium]